MAQIIYKNKEGQKVPSVTTVLGIINKPALLHWSWSLGIQGIDYRQARDKEADCGTLVHAMVENYLKGNPLKFPDYAQEEIERAEKSFTTFLEWFDNNEFELILSEAGLISEQYQYGGTCDIVARYKGENWLIDIKTSKGVYDEYKLQVSAYKNLLIENGYQIDKVAIIKIDKNEEEFKPVEFIDVSDYTATAWEAFKHALSLHNAMATIKKEGKKK